MLDEAGYVFGLQLFALVRWPAEASPRQTQTLRETPADETGRGPPGPGGPPAQDGGDRVRGGRGGSRWDQAAIEAMV